MENKLVKEFVAGIEPADWKLAVGKTSAKPYAALNLTLPGGLTFTTEDGTEYHSPTVRVSVVCTSLELAEFAQTSKAEAKVAAPVASVQLATLRHSFKAFRKAGISADKAAEMVAPKAEAWGLDIADIVAE
jgi:hypothetical protein